MSFKQLLFLSNIFFIGFSNHICNVDDVYAHKCPGWIPIDNPTLISAVDGVKVALTDAKNKEGAACLDGSVPVMYYREAQDSSARNKWHVFFEGGGACVGDTSGDYEPCFDSCEHRAGTSLGSSAGYPAHSNFDNGYMSTNKNTNPLAYNWNTIYVKYCDGGCHSGDNSTTVKAGNYELHFRGLRNVQGVFAELIANYNFSSATDVLVSGCSAGGVATYSHAQMIYDNYVPPGAHFMAMPDSGFFLEVESRGRFIDANRWVFENMNTSASMSAACLEKYASDPFQCGFAQNMVEFIQVPMFALQARFDAWQTLCIIETVNPAVINEYGNNFTRIFMNSFINGGDFHVNHGAFLDSCHHHCGEWNAMHVNGMDQSEAELQFWSKHAATDQHLWFQNATYPCSSCCND